MTPETKQHMSLMCARPIERLSDMQPIEIAASLNGLLAGMTKYKAEAHLLTRERDAAEAELAQARELLRRVKADRPSAHSDDVWLAVCAFLASGES